MEPEVSSPFSQYLEHFLTMWKVNPVQALPSYFLKTYVNIIFPIMPTFPKWTLSVTFPHQKPLCTSSPPLPATYPAITFLWIDQPVNNCWWVQIMKDLTVQFSPLLSPLNSSLLGPNIFVSAYSWTPTAYDPLSSRDQVSHPCKTIGKFTAVLIFIPFILGQPSGRQSCLDQTVAAGIA